MSWAQRAKHCMKQSHSQTQEITFCYADPEGILEKTKQSKTLI